MDDTTVLGSEDMSVPIELISLPPFPD